MKVNSKGRFKNKPFAIATFASHSALQILKGARDEGFKTIAICEEGRERPYESFGVADEILTLKKFSDYFSLEDTLLEKNAIIIPHGSFVAYVGSEKIQKMRVPYYGAKGILSWESDRRKQKDWLTKADVKMPKLFEKPEDINRPVIVKLHGAAGGHGYFLARTPKEYFEKIEKRNLRGEHAIQEYIIGVPVYAHYFYSPITKELEIMGFDKRYESNADSIGRVAAADQITVDLTTSYTVVGNVPIVVRESLLPEMFSLGDKVIKTSQEIEPPGLFGPFCLEGVITSELEFYVFEISVRIVAGTNPFVQGSPYTALKYKEPMSTGRRIARDIKMAIKKKMTNKIFG